MPQSVIDRVNAMAVDQPKLITFLDKHGMEIGDAEEPIHPPETPYEIPGVVRNIAQIPGVDTAIPIEDTAVEENYDMDGKMNDLINMPKQVDPRRIDEGGNFAPASEDFKPTSDGQHTSTVTHTKTPEVVVAEPSKPSTVTASPQCSKRIRKQVQNYVPTLKGKTYEYSATQVLSTEVEPQIMEMVLMQLTLKAAIKLWGNNATSAAEAEMKQLHWRNTFKPVRWSELTVKQKATVLSHIFIKEMHWRDKGSNSSGW